MEEKTEPKIMDDGIVDKSEPKKVSAPKAGKLAVIRIRSAVQADRSIKETLDMLKLRQKNACAVVDDNQSMRGMLFKVKDYCTYGTIDADTLKLLQEKRGRKDSNVFMLHPPRGGFERKGVKKPFSLGGALGDRKEKINDLLKKMI